MLDNSKDFQDTLHEVLNKRINNNSKQNNVMQQIFERGDKTFGDDLQKILNNNMKPLSEDKTKEAFQPKSEKVKISNNIEVEAQVKSGANIEQILSDNERKSDELTENIENGKEESSQKNLTNREQILKSMYLVALNEYYTLKEKLYKGQIQESDISLNDRHYLKLLQYENYLRKCDTFFKASTGKYICNEDEEISKRENKYAYESSKSEKQLFKQHEDSLNQIDRLNDEIQSKADEIITLNKQQESGNVSDYIEKINELEKEYIYLNVKMSLLTPNILELNRQEDEKELQDDTTTRVVGTEYERKKDKYAMDVDVVRLDGRVDNKKEILENGVGREISELNQTNEQLANSYIDSAEISLKKGEITEAKKMVEKAKDIVGIKSAETIANDKKTDFSELLKSGVSSEDDDGRNNISNETDGIDNHLAEILAGTAILSPVQAECAKAVNTPEERSVNALNRETQENLEKSKEPKQKEKLQDKSR